ncbi:kelch repeat-containing protein [Dactylosporangium sp. NPDC049140]|uniref:Kelch repeat-containing protein n=1 Tax=Dactylosporangium sp. NPDC049140 TaxID=3155647 RepID=UPI0034059115
MSSSTMAATGHWTGTGALPAPVTWAGQHDGPVVLGTGKVLVAGGADAAAGALARAALYDPAAKTWAATGSLGTGRRLHTVTLLGTGKVLVTGGIGGAAAFPAPGLATAELYDPATGTWTATGALHTARWGHSAALVGDKVLVAGGTTTRSGQSVRALRSAELYDPATGEWTEVGPMTDARSGHPAVVLQNGRVLVAGGTAPLARDLDAALAFCELFDPATLAWTPTGDLLVPRGRHRATVLNGGRDVLVTGGGAPGALGDGMFDPSSLSTAELYRQDTGGWSAVADLPGGRCLHRAVAVGTGKVLVVGGTDDERHDAGYQSAVLFDTATAAWVPAGGLAVGRWAFAAVPLSATTVLVGGGVTRSGAAAADPAHDELTAAAEVFDVTGSTP